MDSIIKLRHELHQHPELSGQETETAERIVHFFEPLTPDTILRNLGGNGIAVVFSGSKPGKTVLLRAELDALPIHETNHILYRSIKQGTSHKCGHDGHMAILATVGQELAVKRPSNGQVVLLFQPAEETGAGAAAIISDPLFAKIAPDYAFALHNIPGFPVGQVIIRNGPFSSASRGISIKLIGTPAHAAQPETGQSPAQAFAEIIKNLPGLPVGIAPLEEKACIAIIGAKLGKKAFGTVPGQAEIWATLRSETDTSMKAITTHAETLAKKIAKAFTLDCSIEYSDVFSATINSARANEIIQHSTEAPVFQLEHPFRWSEDFGCFTTVAEGALFGIGAGLNLPELHNNDYDFPDELIAPAARIFHKIIRHCLKK